MWPVMGFTSHQQMHGANLQVVLLLLGARPTSLASIMVIGPHHATATHAGGSSEVGHQRDHMVRQGLLPHREVLAGLSSPVSWWLSRSATPSWLGGRSPRGAPGRHPSADPRRWRPAGGPAGPWPLAGAGLAVCPPAAASGI
jgi:hypothetical protein